MSDRYTIDEAIEYITENRWRMADAGDAIMVVLKRIAELEAQLAAQTARADAAYYKGVDDERTHIWNVFKGFFHREEQKI